MTAITASNSAWDKEAITRLERSAVDRLIEARADGASRYEEYLGKLEAADAGAEEWHQHGKFDSVAKAWGGTAIVGAVLATAATVIWRKQIGGVLPVQMILGAAGGAAIGGVAGLLGAAMAQSGGNTHARDARRLRLDEDLRDHRDWAQTQQLEAWNVGGNLSRDQLNGMSLHEFVHTNFAAFDHDGDGVVDATPASAELLRDAAGGPISSATRTVVDFNWTRVDGTGHDGAEDTRITPQEAVVGVVDAALN